MTRHGPALLALSVLAIAGWTYNVNYDTRAALDRIGDLRASIADEREALQVLRVEWAWLNAPDRLSRLLAEHNATLALAPLTPDALGIVAAVPYPRDLPQPTIPATPPEMLVASAQPTLPGPTEEEPAALVIAAAPEEGGIDPAALEEGGIDPTAPEWSAAAPGAGTPDHGPVLAATEADGPPASIQPAAAFDEKPLLAAADMGASLVPSGRTAAVGGELLLAAPEAEAPAGDPVVAAAAEKAEIVAASTQPASMQEAVTLALIEAGVVRPGAVPATSAILPASAASATPMPRARPAVWSRP